MRLHMTETSHVFAANKPVQRDWSCCLSGSASALASEGRGFESRPCHTKGVKNGTLLRFSIIRQALASLLQIHIAQPKIKTSQKKSDNIQCLYSPEDRMEDLQLC